MLCCGDFVVSHMQCNGWSMGAQISTKCLTLMWETCEWTELITAWCSSSSASPWLNAPSMLFLHNFDHLPTSSFAHGCECQHWWLQATGLVTDHDSLWATCCLGALLLSLLHEQSWLTHLIVLAVGKQFLLLVAGACWICMLKTTNNHHQRNHLIVCCFSDKQREKWCFLVMAVGDGGEVYSPLKYGTKILSSLTHVWSVRCLSISLSINRS